MKAGLASSSAKDVYSMSTAIRQFIAKFLLLLVGLTFATGCQQRCQPQSEQVPTTLSETSWRLVETNDPQILNSDPALDRFNFLIINFSRNFSGNIQRVVFNDLFEAPVLTFNWNPVERNRMLVRFQTAVNEDFDSFGGGSTAQDLGVSDFSYEFDANNFQMSDRESGVFYRYVPFTGVVDPDSQCTF